MNFDEGVTNISQMARIDSLAEVSSGPRVDSEDVTNEISQIVYGGVVKQLWHRTYGNGLEGCLIYGSWLDLVWA